MFDRGYWHVGTLRGVPIRLHWSIPLGCIVFSGFNFVPAFWVSFTFLVLAHELGHAAVVRWFRHRTLSVDVTGFGGLCRWSGHASPFERSAIAWGGVLAQAAILLPTYLLVTFLGAPTNPHVSQVVYAFTHSNMLLIGLNLLPFPPLDGAEAWKIFRQGRFHGWLASLRDRVRRRPKRAPPRSASPAKVIDLEGARRKRQKDVAHDPGVRQESPKELADELIRLSEEAARARKKRDEN
jgi:hypothetical protein